jgi:hypothetical protein
VVPAAVLVAVIARRFRLAIGLALAGVGVYVLAKVVKRFVERGRPGTLLDEVVVRGAEPHGLGFILERCQVGRQAPQLGLMS